VRRTGSFSANVAWVSDGTVFCTLFTGDESDGGTGAAVWIELAPGCPSNCSARPLSKNNAVPRHKTAPTAPHASSPGMLDLRRYATTAPRDAGKSSDAGAAWNAGAPASGGKCVGISGLPGQPGGTGGCATFSVITDATAGAENEVFCARGRTASAGGAESSFLPRIASNAPHLRICSRSWSERSSS
jgi:hypothetical protein